MLPYFSIRVKFSVAAARQHCFGAHRLWLENANDAQLIVDIYQTNVAVMNESAGLRGIQKQPKQEQMRTVGSTN